MNTSPVLSRRRLLALAPLPIIGLTLAGCPSTPGPGDLSSLNKTVFASQTAAAVLFKAASVLVNTCVITKTGSIGEAIDVSFTAVANLFDSVNAALQAGALDAANLALSTALVALQQAQIAFQKLQVTPAQSVAIRKAMPKAGPEKKSMGFAAIAALVIQFLPILLSGGADIVSLVKSLIASISAPDSDTTSLDDVKLSNDSMHAGLATWAAAACVK